ncbi:hypothetical protein DFQ26_008078, partial [Actinomortierella ambigua]
EPVTLFVKGFPLITGEEVKTMSIQVGAVSVRSMGPRNAKNAAFMDFLDRAAAERGIEALNAWTFPASPLSRLRAEFAKSKGSRVTESIPRPPSLASPTTMSPRPPPPPPSGPTLGNGTSLRPPFIPPPAPTSAGEPSTAQAFSPSFIPPDYSYYSAWTAPWSSYYGSPTSASLVPTNQSAAITTTKNTKDSTWSEPMQDVVSSQYDHNNNLNHHHPPPERDEYLEALLELRPYQKQAQTGFVNIMRAIKEHAALLGHVRLRMRELQLPDPFSTAAASSPATPMTAANKGMVMDLDPPPLSSLEMAVYLSDPLNYQPPPSKPVQNQQQQQSQESGGSKVVKPPTTLTTPAISSSLSPSDSIAAPQLHHDSSETSLLAAVDQWKKGSRVAEATTKQIAAAATAGAEKENGVETKGKRRMEQGHLSPRGIPENSNGQQSLSSDESEIESEPEQSGGGPKRRRLTREEAEEIVRQQEQLPKLPSSPPLPQQQQQQHQTAPSTHEKAKSSSSKGSASASTKKELQAGSNEASKGATGQPPPQQQDKGRKKKKKRPKKKRNQLAKEEAAMDVEGGAPLTLSSDALSEKPCKNGVSKLPGSTVSSAASAAAAAPAATKAEETLPILPEAGTVTITAEHSQDKRDGKLEAAHKEAGENEAVSTVAAPNDNITLLTENGSSLLLIPTTSSTTITATATTTRSKAAPAPANEAKGDQNLPLTTSARKRAQRKLRQEHGQHRRQQPAQNAALEGSDKTLNEDGKEMVVTKKKIPNKAPKKEDEDEEQKPQQPVSPQQPTMVEDALEDKGAQATTSADPSSLP